MGRPKKNENIKKEIIENKEVKKTSVNSNVNNELEEENQKLKSELNDIKILLQNLMASNSNNNFNSDIKENDSSKIVKNKTFDLSRDEFKLEEYVEIQANKRIPIISLYDGTLILVAGKYGKGKPYTFEKFGKIDNIIYSDLAEILHYQYSFAEKGYFYICDKNVISNHGLHDIYSKILNKEMIENILSFDKQDIIKFFKETTEAQKENIISLLINKIIKNEDIDLNKVNVISKIYGRDILEIANSDSYTYEDDKE